MKEQIFKSFDSLPVSLGDKGRSVWRGWRSCRILAGRQLDCLGWGQCNTLLQKHLERLVYLCNEISAELGGKLFPLKIQTWEEEKKTRPYRECGTVSSNTTVRALELTAAVFRVAEPELQAGGRGTFLRAIRRADEQPKILLQMI